MSRLVWNDPSTRFYEIGVSDAAVYLPDGRVAPWNGLISVKENPAGGELSSYYLDGDIYYNHVSPEDYQATVEAFTYPPELDSAMGIETDKATGIQYPGQERHTFGLVYKTQVGSALGSNDYKLHIVYGATLAVSSREYSTIGDSPEPTVFSWDLSAVPVDILGRRNTAHIVIDSRKVSRLALGVFEGYLYGTNGVLPQLPSISQIASFFAQFTNLTVEFPVTYKGSLDRDLSNNLITNPGFDTDLSGWSAASSGTFDRVAGGGFDLTGSAIGAYARMTSLGTSSLVNFYTTIRTPVPAGTTHVTIGVWATSDADTELAIQANITATSGSTYPKSTWLAAPWYEGRWITHVFELPADVNSVGASLVMRNSNSEIVPSGKRMWADNFVMNLGITDGLYHDPFPAPWTKGDAYTIAGKLSVYDGSKWYRPSRYSLTLF